MDTAEIRRQVLRSFLADNGGFAAVVARHKLTPSQASYLSQLTAQESTASFGERSAKNWEARLKMDDMSLVRPSVIDVTSVAKEPITDQPNSTTTAERRAPQEMLAAARRRQIAEDVVTLLEDIDDRQDLLMAWNAAVNAIEQYKKEMEERTRRPVGRATKTHPESKQPAAAPTIHTSVHR